jgi:Zn-dependent M28 family amino/carboxypeptidase
VAFGAEHSSLGPSVEQAAARLGVRVSPDPAPEESIFIRSDQYSFVKKGIPSVFVVSGQDDGSGGARGREQEETWDRNVYHTPGDDMSQEMDFEAGAVFARINLILGFEVAEASERPRWNAGDFFGTRFAGAAP